MTRCLARDCRKPFERPTRGNPSPYCPGCRQRRRLAGKVAWHEKYGRRRHVSRGIQTLRATKTPEAPTERFGPAKMCVCPTPQPRTEGPILTCRWCTRVIALQEAV